MEQQQRVENWIDRASRREVAISAIAHRSDGTNVEVRVLNISYEGCQFESAVLFTVEERFILTFPGLGEIEAQVRWTTSNGKAGVKFLLEKPALQDPRARILRRDEKGCPRASVS